MKKFLASIALTGALLSGAAMAADVKVAPAPASSYNWDGFHIGALGTYGWAQSHHCDAVNCPDNPVPDSGPTVNGTGFGGGAEVGFDKTFNNVLLGVEADYSFIGINGSAPSQVTPSYGCVGNCITNVTGLGTARLRVGLPLNNILPYLTGGLAISSVHGQLGTLGGSDTTFVNATAGAGVEFGVTPNISLKAEYLHIFDNGQRFIFLPTGCVAPGCSINHYSDDLARVGINFRF